MNTNTRHLRPLGSTSLLCHPLGFGCYRIADGNEEHEAALRDYLERGGNLIDTSANYTDGQSETLVGKVAKDYPRDRAIIVTKAGYIQGKNMELAQSRSFPEVVKYGEGIWHCIHPEFLETQIILSSQRLQLDSIDVFLLHNPEYFLGHQSHHKSLDSSDHNEFYRRIGQAFQFLEKQVQAGKIRWYGISSNNYGLPLSDPMMTSVERCLGEAEKLGGDHHFRVVQLPMNLYESGGALERNNADLTVLDFCHRHGLGVLVNRPLNAFVKNQLIRLADFSRPSQNSRRDDSLEIVLGPLRKHESTLADQVSGVSGSGLAEVLKQIVPQVRSVDHWEQVVGRYVLTPLERWVKEMSEKHGLDSAWDSWLQGLFPLIHSTFEEIERWIQSQQQAVSDEVRKKLQKAGYPETDHSLSQISLNVLMSLEGLSSVLTGMRRRAYVEDSFLPPNLSAVNSRSILQEFHKLI